MMSKAVANNTLEKIKLRLEELEKSAEIPEEDRQILSEILENFNEFFKIDTPYKLSLIHPNEFIKSNVFLYDPSREEIYSMEDYLKEHPAYQLMASNLVQIVRVYVTQDIRQILKKYNILPDNGLELTTRW